MTVTAHPNIEAKCAGVSEKDATVGSVRAGQVVYRGDVKGIRLNRNERIKRQRRAVALTNDMGIVNLFCY